MNETSLSIMGSIVTFQYTIHNENFVEWQLHPDSVGPNRLLETLLRIHYCALIESHLKEHWYYAIYAEQEQNIERFPDVPF